MPTVVEEAVEIQRRYYSETAAKYEGMHEHEGSGDAFSNQFVNALLQMLEARSVLDVGTATGRGLLNLRAALPDAFLCGVEPVAALLREAKRKNLPPYINLVCGDGLSLPFADESFDAVCEFGILHHVHDPNAVVREMLRVARKAVVICDSNRFGQGSLPARITKLGIYKAGLWGAFDWIRTRGKGYMTSEGDGLFYSYSVYDSYELLASWADRLMLIPGSQDKAKSWLHPLLNNGGMMACAIKEKA